MWFKERWPLSRKLLLRKGLEDCEVYELGLFVYYFHSKLKSFSTIMQMAQMTITILNYKVILQHQSNI